MYDIHLFSDSQDRRSISVRNGSGIRRVGLIEYLIVLEEICVNI